MVHGFVRGICKNREAFSSARLVLSLCNLLPQAVRSGSEHWTLLILASFSRITICPQVTGLDRMEHINFFLITIYGSILFQYCFCVVDNVTESPETKLSCTCTRGRFSKSNYFPIYNCSTLCNCTLGPGNDDGQWACLCSSTVFSTSSTLQVGSCFTSCNCTSDTSNGSTSTVKKHVSTTLLAVILLGVVLATISASAMVAYYFHRKDQFLNRPGVFSSETTSVNSGSNLLSHHTGIKSSNQVKDSGMNFFSGFVTRTSFFKSKGALPGLIMQFSYHDLEHATNKFSDDNLLGIGGSSKVYRGCLRDGKIVAIKRLNLLLGSHANNEFLSEVEIMSRLNHCHVVPLLGYCSEINGKHVERLLVSEYMPNGNLRDCLDASCRQEALKWEARVNISLGVAKGLEYLHEEAAPRILHRDIKSTNILLDNKYKPKITDLGMAKRLMTDDCISCGSSPARMMGTFGYFAPECSIIGRASLKSDVFSFGVVLLELITGQKPIRRSSSKGDESLVLSAMTHLHDSKSMISNLPDPLLEGKFKKEEMRIMAHLARECLHWDPESRPTMCQVVQIISAISPDRPKQKSFVMHLLLSSLEGNEGSSNLETNGMIDPPPSEIAETSQTRASSGTNNFSIPSSQYVDNLTLSTSNPRSYVSDDDDEAMDLMEPRLESFVQMPSMRSS